MKLDDEQKKALSAMAQAAADAMEATAREFSRRKLQAQQRA